jgi:hypothetical protein
MNFDKLNSGVSRVKLRPIAIQRTNSGQVEQFDDDWEIKSATRSDGIKLQNLRSGLSIVLNEDHVHHFTSAPIQSDRIPRGFLELSVHLEMSDRSIEVSPILIGPARFAGVADEEADELWTRATHGLLAPRPPMWEHLLTCEYLDAILVDGRTKLAELGAGLIYRRITAIREDATMDKLSELFAELNSVAEKLGPTVQQIPPSWGPPGVPGNPSEIRRACDRVRSLIQALLDWEIELHFISVPKKFENAFLSLRGSVGTIFNEVERIPRELRIVIGKALTNPGTYACEIMLTPKSPPQFERFKKEMKRLKGGFRIW